MAKKKKPKIALKSLLIKNNISQYELAKRLNIEPNRISKMIKPEFNPTFSTLSKIAEALDCQIKDLIEE